MLGTSRKAHGTAWYDERVATLEEVIMTRDVLWVMVVLAIALAWWIDRSRLLIEHNDKQHKLQIFMHSEMKRIEEEINAGWEEDYKRLYKRFLESGQVD